MGGRVLNNKLDKIFILDFIARSVIRGYIFSVRLSMSEMLELISSHNEYILILGFLMFSRKYLNWSRVIEVFSLSLKKATVGSSEVLILLSSVEVRELDLERLVLAFFFSG